MTKHALYRFYNDSGQLLYVGVTNAPWRRFTEHAKDKPWWTKVRGISVDWYDDRRSILSAEKRAIRIENPLYNIRGKDQTDETTPEENTSTAAAVAFCRTWGRDERTEHLWEPFNKSIDHATQAGFSHLEVTEAAKIAGRFRDPDTSRYLPAYPGHIHETTVADLAQAVIYLNQFVQEEVHTFRAMAAEDQQMWNAHWHELTIRAAWIADFQTEEHGRDEEMLHRYLESLPGNGGEGFLDAAHEEFNSYQGAYPVERDSPEILELAIANAMGVTVPDTRVVRAVT